MRSLALEASIQAATKASEILLDYHNKKNAGRIEKKGRFDRVSDADLESEKVIVNILQSKFPDYNINGEELGQQAKGSEYTWFIDPLCGSNDFIRGFKDFGLSIALVKGEDVILGVCSLPAQNELYWAEKGSGAYLNGEKISVSKISETDDSIITTHTSAKEQDLKDSLVLIGKFAGHYWKVPGSFPASVCNLARGLSDVHVELHVGPVHRLAATFIAVEAGGKATRIDGSPSHIFDNEILVTNDLLHESMVQMLK